MEWPTDGFTPSSIRYDLQEKTEDIPIQKTLLFPETENTSALTGYKIKKALYK